MGNLGFAFAICLQKAVVAIFLGNLRDLEIEMIRERISSTVMEVSWKRLNGSSSSMVPMQSRSIRSVAYWPRNMLMPSPLSRFWR